MDKIKLNNKRVIITGAAGFIGANLVMELLHNTESVRIIGIDSVNDYYDVSLKEYRLQQIGKLADEVTGTFEFIKGNIADKTLISEVFERYKPDIVVNLAAQAGVRYYNGPQKLDH